MNYDVFLASFDVTQKDVEQIKEAEARCLDKLKENIEKNKNNPDEKIDFINATIDIATLQSIYDAKIKSFSNKVEDYLRNNDMGKDEVEEFYKAYNEKIKWYRENTVEFLGKDVKTLESVYKNIKQGIQIDVDNIFVLNPKTSEMAPKKEEPVIEENTVDEKDDEKDIEDEDSTSLEEEKEANSIINELIETRRQLKEVRKKLRQIKREEFIKSAEELYVNSKNDKAKVKELKREYKEALEKFDKEYEVISADIQERRDNAENNHLVYNWKLLKQEDSFKEFKKVAPLVKRFEKEDKEFAKGIDRLDAKIQKEENPEKKKNLVEQRNKLKAERENATEKFAKTDTGVEYFKQKKLVDDAKNNVLNAEKEIKNIDQVQKMFDKQVDDKRKEIEAEFKNKLPARQDKKGIISKMIGAIKHKLGRNKDDVIQESVFKRAVASISDLSANAKNLVSEKWNKLTDISQSEILNKMKEHLDKRIQKTNEQIESRQPLSQQQNNETPEL